MSDARGHDGPAGRRGDPHAGAEHAAADQRGGARARDRLAHALLDTWSAVGGVIFLVTSIRWIARHAAATSPSSRWSTASLALDWRDGFRRAISFAPWRSASQRVAPTARRPRRALRAGVRGLSRRARRARARRGLRPRPRGGRRAAQRARPRRGPPRRAARRARRRRAAAPRRRCSAGAEFLRESLSTFEIVHRGYHEVQEVARLEHEHVEQLRALADASVAINSSMTVEEILQLTADAGARRSSAPRARPSRSTRPTRGCAPLSADVAAAARATATPTARARRA